MATWLDQVNIIRGMAGFWSDLSGYVPPLPPVTEDTGLSDANRKLSQYEVENLQNLSHLDGQNNNPNFTAAQNSDLWGSSWNLASEVAIINQWGFGIFHRLAMLDPRLKKVGFGSYSAPPSPPNVLTAITWSGGYVTATTTTAHGIQAGQWAKVSGVAPPGYNGQFTAAPGTTGNTLVYALATDPGTATGMGMLNRPLQSVAALNIYQGLDGAVPPPPSSPNGAWHTNVPWPIQFANNPAPVMFPNGIFSVSANTYPNETPDARASTQCTDFMQGPAGLPISLQVGPGNVSETKDSWLNYGDPSNPDQTPTRVEICIIDQNNFTIADKNWERVVRSILSGMGAVVLLPRRPLAVGLYTAHVEIGPPSSPKVPFYEWSFRVVAEETSPAAPMSY